MDPTTAGAAPRARMPFALLGAISALIGVAAGAFGAHALRESVEPGLLQAFETGVRYQLLHALALIAVDLLGSRRARAGLTVSGALFVAGTVLFSGSLYTLVLTGVRAWGAVTPLGGVCFLAGWLSLALAVRRA